MKYPFGEIEKKWQNFWIANKTFATDSNSNKPKYYCLDMFPYPSGAGLHVGHPAGYTATDILSRYKRMKGFEVLHPMGWDAFGLPAERYAMETNIHPSITTKNNIDTFRKQIQNIGLSYDWDREISTTDLDYVRFTQWIFLKIYSSYFDPTENKAKSIANLVSEFAKNGSPEWTKDALKTLYPFSATDWEKFPETKKETILSSFRLVYLSEIPVNWCEKLGTVLANEEVEEWVSKGYTVERKPMKQYMMRITAYAERLLDDLSFCEWPTSTLEMQKNWIGKSIGLEMEFALQNPVGDKKNVSIFTTRPDTIFGVTYMVLAPEHELIDLITTDSQKKQVLEYANSTKLKSDMDRQNTSEKTGVFTGAYCIHPFTKKEIPIFTSDYVLATYGTGAVMAVPAHDERDFAFAKKFSLPIVPVIEGGTTEEVFDSKESKCINSSSELLSIDGLSYGPAFEKIADFVTKEKIGKKKVQYKLRDWLFARQRYWGEPIPLVHFEDGTTLPISESELPLALPNLKEFKPSGSTESPLALATDWVQYSHPTKATSGRRETNTMPQWAGSCWYYLRFISPKFSEGIVDPVLEQKWMPVDLYVGGAEHAVLHLLYSRFWHKILFDLGYVSTKEPFRKLFHQGLILGEDKRKMSKSLKNVVNPDEVIREYGADALRLYEMFMGPLDMVKPWSTKGVEGVFRFLNRVWRMFHNNKEETFFVDDTEPSLELTKLLHRSIKKVGEDIENLSFNTAISQMMIFVNEITPLETRPKKILTPFLLLLAPFAPHLAEELWEKLGNKNTLAKEQFPSYDSKFLEDEEIKIVVQVNGKLRGEFLAPKDIHEKDAIAKAKAVEKVIPFLEGKTIRKEIYVAGKLVNLVV